MASSRMTALLALPDGYQNRDRLGEILGNITGQRSGSSGARASSNEGGLGGLVGVLFGGGGAREGVTGGLGELIENQKRSWRGGKVLGPDRPKQGA